MATQIIHVLLIEDNPGDADLLRIALPQAFGAGVDLHHALTLSEGEALIAERDFDLIMLDLTLPDSHGVQTVDRVTAAAPHTPVVVMTGHADAETGVQAVSRGAQDYLVKGQVDLDLIMRSMRYAIERKRTEKAERQQRLLAEALLDTATVLTSTLDLDEVLERILAHVKRIVPNDGAILALTGADGIRLAGVYGDETVPELPADTARLEHLLEDVIDFGGLMTAEQPIIVADSQGGEQPGDADLVGAGRSWLGVPIRLRDETIGLLVLMGKQPDAFDKDEAAHLQAFAGYAAIAISNARRFTEREEAVAEATTELRQTVEHLRAILDSSPDAVLLLDGTGRIQTMNRAFLQSFACDEQQAIHRHLTEIFHTDSRSPIGDALLTVTENRKMVRLRVSAQPLHGDVFDVHAALAPVEEDHTLLGVVCILREVEAVKEYDRLRDAFVTMATHELRTPLTIIQGFSELLLTRDLDLARIRYYLTYIHKQAVLLGHIVDDLMDLSLVQSGHELELEIEPVNLAEVVAQALSASEAAAPRHTFAVEGFDDLPLVAGDRKRLVQIVENLLSNAVKFSPEGSTTRVWARPRPDVVEIGVTDQGIGLTDQQQWRVFDYFYRADSSDSGVGGTGLGLTISRIIVEAHGGRLWVESEPGQGSTFIFSIPVHTGDVLSSS